ncbi:MAG: LysM peptidoglycan-binding domain-containing protein [Alistipes sp.]|nr:LysM peptidoglycan-binding domain-containing protein [Alistipes sp.]
MRFFKRILTLGLLLSSLTATAAEHMPDIEQSKVIVFISGKKYYIHTVQQGNTLYSIAKAYDISEAEIKEHNPNVTEGLKIGQTIKIPVSEKSIAQVEKRRKKEFIAHKIKAGQTLYSIARDYNISVATLCEDNPSLNPQSLSIGETIWVRRTGVGTSSEQEAQSEINEYADNLNKATEDGYEYVVVKPGETIYSLTRKYEITEEEFTSLNDVSAGLKAGAVVRIPNKTINSVDQMDKAADIAMQEEKNKTFTADENIIFQAVSSQDELNVALMLPINVNSKPNASYVEFYQGFLLGLEKLKEQGKGKTNLAVYNTQHDTQAVQRIVNSPAFAKTNLIVGPVYEDELKPVINFAHANAVPVISPLANIVAVKSPALYQLSPDAECKYDKIANLIDGSRDIYLIYASAYDKEFEQEIKKQLEGKSYATYNYTFDQKSILTPTNALAQQIESVDELLKKEKPALFIVLANTETDVDRILGTLASSKVAITERSENCANYVVLGTSRWSRFNNIDQTSYFNNNVVMISTYHAKRDSALVREFDSRYIEAYKMLPSLYAYRGYDTAIIFCGGMRSDIEYNMLDKRYTPLQTGYKFFQTEIGGKYINREWVRINYNSNYSITLE